jgi:hypothetical protein
MLYLAGLIGYVEHQYAVRISEAELRDDALLRDSLVGVIVHGEGMVCRALSCRHQQAHERDA